MKKILMFFVLTVPILLFSNPYSKLQLKKKKSGIGFRIFWYTAKNIKKAKVKNFTFPVYHKYPIQKMNKIIPIYPGASFRTLKDGTKELYYKSSIPIKTKHLFLGFMYDIEIYERARIIISSSKINWQGKIPKSIREKFLHQAEVEYSPNHLELSKIAQKILEDKPSPVKVVRRVWNFVRNNMTYRKPKRPNTAVWILKNQHGRCGEYTRLTVALLRACGLPARGVYGIKNYTDGPAISSHAWTEVYLPDAGWMPVRSQTRLPGGNKYKFEPRYVLKRFRAKYYNKWLHCKLTKNKKCLKKWRGKRKSRHYFIRKRSAKSRVISGITYFIEIGNESMKNKVIQLFQNINSQLKQNTFMPLKQSYPISVQALYYWFLTGSHNKNVAHSAAYKLAQILKDSNGSLKTRRFLKASPKVLRNVLLKAIESLD